MKFTDGGDRTGIYNDNESEVDETNVHGDNQQDLVFDEEHDVVNLDVPSRQSDQDASVEKRGGSSSEISKL